MTESVPVSQRENPIELLYHARDAIQVTATRVRSHPPVWIRRDVAAYDHAIISTLDNVYVLTDVLSHRARELCPRRGHRAPAARHLTDMQDALRPALTVAHGL